MPETNIKDGDSFFDVYSIIKYVEIEQLPDFKTIVGIYKDNDGRKLLGMTIFHLKYENSKPYCIKFNVDRIDDDKIDWLARVLIYNFIEVIRRATITSLFEVRNAYDNFLMKLK